MKKHMTASSTEARATFKTWLDAALLKGARQAHGLLKRKTGEALPMNPLVVRGTGHLSLGEAMETRALGFESKWNRTSNPSSSKLRVTDFVRRARVTEEVEVDVARFTAGVFKVANTRGLGADSTEAAMLKEAPAAAQLEYMGIVSDVISQVAWLVQVRWVKSRLLPKPTGGERAIGVTAFLYALVGGCFANELAT